MTPEERKELLQGYLLLIESDVQDLGRPDVSPGQRRVWASNAQSLLKRMREILDHGN